VADIVRQALNELSVKDLITRETIIDTMVQYFNRYSDIFQVRSAIKVRHGYGIKAVRDPNDDTAPPLETYVKENFHEQVDAGMVDNVTIGFGQKVTNALATLFTESGQKFSLTHETVDDVKLADDLLNEYRKKGTFLAALTKADQRAVQVGSSAVLVSFARDVMSYQVLSPADIRAFYAETITEEGTVRGVDKADIEDASVVIIRLSAVDAMTWNYLAIYGASDLYPLGRYVTYQASNLSTQIPSYGEGDSIDYEIEGVGPCNPLTYWAEQNPELDLPEYPIAVFDGGLTEDGTVMPYTVSLHECALKFDEKASHILATSQDAARGTTVVKRTHEGANKALPRTLIGKIALDVGLEVEHIGHDSQASVDAMTVLEKEMIQLGGSYGVPAYMIVEEDSHFMQASSGVALQVKTSQLKKNRQRRVKENAPSVQKVFDIEKAQLGLFSEDPAVPLLLECTQSWDAGDIKLPQNKTEVAEYLDKMGPNGSGVMDTIAQIKEWYQCASDAEAIEIYEKMKERRQEFPPLVEEKKPQRGLLTRGQQPLQAVK